MTSNLESAVKTMAQQRSSIKSCFSPSHSSISGTSSNRSDELQSSSSSHNFSDGFSNEERRVDTRVQAVTNRSWVPQQDYDDIDIADIIPGPGCRTFMGRVVNLFDQPHASKKPLAAKGCMKMIIKDDTGAISVLFDVEFICLYR